MIDMENETINWVVKRIESTGRFAGKETRVYLIDPQLIVGPEDNGSLPLAIVTPDDGGDRPVALEGVSSNVLEMEFDIEVWARSYPETQAILSDCRRALSKRLKSWDRGDESFENASEAFRATRTANIPVW